MFYVDQSLPYWVTIIVAAIAGVPAYIAMLRQRRRDAKSRSDAIQAGYRSNHDHALHGFEILLEELRTELDRRTRMFELDLARAEAVCQERIKVARKEMRDAFNSLVKGHNRLDLEFNQGKNQIEEQNGNPSL